MAIATNRDDLEKAKFKESTTTSGQAGIVVVNPDGTTVGAALPSGAATETTLGDIKTSVQLIDDVVGTTAATAPTKAVLMGGVSGGNIVSIGLAAGGGILVGTTTPGTGTANLGKAIDAVAGGSDVGVASLAKRTDSLASITPAAGDWAALQVDNQGALWVHNSVLQTTSYQKANITTATTTTSKSGGGVFHGLIINKAVATGVITIYDNTAASGTVIGTITFGAALLSDPPIMVLYDVNVTTGITIVTSAAFDITVMYQ